jgi:hypothetical protein
LNTDQYRDYLLHSIRTASIASGGRVINCRCFYCPDSKNPSSKHMYISIPQQKNEPSLYYCHKCHATGIVTYKNLIEWDIYDDTIAMELIELNKACSNNKSFSKFLGNTRYPVSIRNTRIDKGTEIKLKYINDRLGTRLTYKDCRDLKIVLNLNDMMQDNNIRTITRSENIVDQLDKNFLGFLSIDNAFFNMRRICDKGLVDKSIDKRYINYRIFDKYNTSERFYTVHTSMNICIPTRVKIHIAEGPFDILSIYKNVRAEEPGIYTSIAGSNYKGQIIYFLEKYKLPYTEIHLYPDNDKYGRNVNMQKISSYLRPLNIPVYVHRNMYPNEKDFGVRPDHIKESIIRI